MKSSKNSWVEELKIQADMVDSFDVEIAKGDVCEGKQLNKPFKSSAKGKKKTVCVKDGDNAKPVHYGAQGYKHNYADGANDNFHARHNC